MQALDRWKRSSWVLLALAVVAAAGGGWAAFARGSVGASGSNAVVAAWNRARAEGSYHFTSDVVQVATPAGSVLNAGRAGQSQRVHVDGVSDVGAAAMELELSTTGTSAAGGQTLAVRVVDGVTFQRDAGGGWVKSAAVTDALAPGADFMSVLGAASEVSVAGSDTVAGSLVTKYSFTVDGSAFAAARPGRTLRARARRGRVSKPENTKPKRSDGIQLRILRPFRTSIGTSRV